MYTVGFVGNEDDVAARGDDFVFATGFVWGKFLDGGEDDATGRDVEFVFEVGPVYCLDGLLAQQGMAFRESGEKLLVQVVAIGEDDQGGVCHCRMLDNCFRHRMPLTGSCLTPGYAR